MEEGGRSDHGCPLQEEALRRGTLSRPKPGLSALQPHESGCWVYFLVSAKFILSFLFPARWSLVSYRKPKSSLSSKLGARLAQCQNSGWVWNQ